MAEKQAFHCGFKVNVFDLIFIHEREYGDFFMKRKVYLRFFDFLFGEVSENFDAIREAEIGNKRNARDVVVAVFHLFVFNLDNALNATVRNVKVKVAFFDFIFHVVEIG